MEAGRVVIQESSYLHSRNKEIDLAAAAVKTQQVVWGLVREIEIRQCKLMDFSCMNSGRDCCHLAVI
jgi:hypothetical protein